MVANALGKKSLVSVMLLLVVSPTLWAQWVSVGDGIDYTEYSLSGPNELYVTRMDRSNQNCFIESTIGQGRTSGGTETVRSQASKADDAIGYWGQNWGNRNDVVVAINGSYYNTSTGVPLSGLIHSGSYDKRFDNMGGQSGFFWSLNRVAAIGECITHYATKQFVTYSTSNTQQFVAINEAPADNKLTIFTPQYDTTTGTNNTVSEVLVQLSTPFLLKPTPAFVSGTVLSIRPNQGSTMMPFDCIVLSAKGSAATTMLNNVTVGSEVRISQEIKNYLRDCSTPRSLDWTKAYASVSGNWVFLNNNVIEYGIDKSGLRHPRTAIALNDDYVYFIVCDGRSSQSIGMLIDELAEFCKYTLGATWGVNQDGGGSSTMVVNGIVKNVPSDGSERAVSNGIMMVNLAPKTESETFATGNDVKTTTTANVRLGPGTNYAVITSVSANTEGTIIDHPLKGVYAKGYYWWNVDFNGTTGWVAESLLMLVSSGDPPYIIQHPASQSVVAGGNVTFFVQAGGATPLSYAWFKDSVDLSDDAPFSGTATSTMTITGASPAEQGNYHCVVTNSDGSAISHDATLTVTTAGVDFDSDGDVDLDDFGYLQNCLGIDNVVGTNPACADADANDDGNVNVSDLTQFISCLSGPQIPAAPACLD